MRIPIHGFKTSPALLSLAMIVIGLVSAPREAYAIGSGGNIPGSLKAYGLCRKLGGSIVFCSGFAIGFDPTAVEVTGVTLSIDYDPAVYVFDQAESGPLGVFSVGGGNAAATPGVGTEPLTLLPSTGLTPGTALPGSTLTYNTATPGLLTVSYQFASPISVSNDVNLFLLDFNLLKPETIDLAQSTVTYAASGPGADFTQSSFTCTTTDPTMPGCGSSSPATGITIHPDVVPEPSFFGILIAGLGLIAGARFLRVGTTTAE